MIRVMMFCFDSDHARKGVATFVSLCIWLNPLMAENFELNKNVKYEKRKHMKTIVIQK